MATYRLHLTLLLLLLIYPRAVAQDEETEPARDLKTVSIGFSMDNITASSVGLRAGLDLEEFVSLGVLWEMGFTSEGKEPATELGVGVWTDAVLLSEENDLPVTFIVHGEFLKTRILSSYLEDNALVKSGTGYLLGAAVSRRFILSETSVLGAEIDGWYQFHTYTLEAEAGSGIDFETRITPSTDYFYGLSGTYEMTLAENMTIALGLNVHLNSQLHIFYGPQFYFMTW